MTDLERLVAIEAIKALMARRIRALDSQDWETYAACHAPDHISHGAHFSPGAGRDAMMTAVRASLEGIQTFHHVHSPEISVLSPVEAKGSWYLEDRLYWTQGHDEHWIHGWAYYDDTYGKRDGEWLFTSRRLSYMRTEHSPGSRRVEQFQAQGGRWRRVDRPAGRSPDGGAVIFVSSPER